MKANPRVISFHDETEIRAEMARLGVDPRGIGFMAPKAIRHVIKVEGILPAAANILKQEMLSKGGDAAVPRNLYHEDQQKRCDVLLIGNMHQYRDLVKKLHLQPFRLPQLADEIDAALSNYYCDRGSTQCGNLLLEWGKRTYVIGIINLTPDSFAGDGLGGNVDAAIAQAHRFIDEGVDVIDVGGESTRPGSTPVPLDDELARVTPFIQRLAKQTNTPISIDTYKAEVARQAIEAGASMVNDVWGLRRDPQLAGIVAAYSVPLVIMHNRPGVTGNSTLGSYFQEVEYKELMADVVRALRESLELAEAADIKRENIIIDPGIGFGKTREQNLEVLHRLDELKVLGRPILLGTSRKSTIGYILNLPPDQRVEGTAATVALGIANGADMVRVHDVKEMVRVCRMTDAIVRRTWPQSS